MDHYKPNTLKESPTLITMVDPQLSSGYKLNSNKGLIRTIKANIIWGGVVTIPSSIILSSPQVGEALKSLEPLLQNGLIIPDLRSGLKDFNEQFETSSITDNRLAKYSSEIASFLNENTYGVIEYNSKGASRAFIKGVLVLVLIAKLKGLISITWKELELASINLSYKKVVSRNEVYDIAKKIKSGRTFFYDIVVVVYHLVGSGLTGSTPLFPQRTKTNVRKVLELIGFFDAKKIYDLANTTIAKKNVEKLLDLIEIETTSIFDLNDYSENSKIVNSLVLFEVFEALSIKTSLLDKLEDKQIMEIAKSSEAIRAKEAIHKLLIDNNKEVLARKKSEVFVTNKELIEFKKSLNDYVVKEPKSSRRIGGFGTKLGIGSIGVGALTFPFDGGIGLALSLSSLLLSIGGIGIDHYSRQKARPIHLFVEKIQTMSYSEI